MTDQLQNVLARLEALENTVAELRAKDLIVTLLTNLSYSQDDLDVQKYASLWTEDGHISLGPKTSPIVSLYGTRRYGGICQRGSNEI